MSMIKPQTNISQEALEKCKAFLQIPQDEHISSGRVDLMRECFKYVNNNWVAIYEGGQDGEEVQGMILKDSRFLGIPPKPYVSKALDIMVNNIYDNGGEFTEEADAAWKVS
jgi:hypothetical protein